MFGYISIEQINITFHIIRNFPIKAITQTISIQTIISPNHKVFFLKIKSIIEFKQIIDQIEGI